MIEDELERKLWLYFAEERAPDYLVLIPLISALCKQALEASSPSHSMDPVFLATSTLLAHC